VISQGPLKIGYRADILFIKKFEVSASGGKQIFDHKNLAGSSNVLQST
jgi:hypothetical protein